MESFILDTNLFFNMEEGLNMGNKTEEVVINITTAIKKKKIPVFMPPRIVDEFLSFFEDKEQNFIKEFLSSIVIKTPDINKLTLPAQLFYQIVGDIRERSYRGLRIGEEEIVQAGRATIGKSVLNKKDFEITIGKAIKSFRDRYRQATRFGFLDSLADLDLIVLTKELDGCLVSTDEGVVKWGRGFGVKEIPAAAFGSKLAEL